MQNVLAGVMAIISAEHKIDIEIDYPSQQD